ncbi:unnamed protein product [Amoebophrya sp. A120]|nr:unnamed protein product [Amoebophrya sp. A120]|eukprot:GSA120T00003706001.1
MIFRGVCSNGIPLISQPRSQQFYCKRLTLSFSRVILFLAKSPIFPYRRAFSSTYPRQKHHPIPLSTKMATSTSKDQLLAVFKTLDLKSTKTIQHEACPTCEVHTEQLKSAKEEKTFGEESSIVQAKNLFFKVPSKGGPLKDKLFLVCVAVDTEVDNKKLSARLGIKASAPLRLAAENIFDEVLQIPRGSVNPFVMMNESAKEVTLLLDEKFKQKTCLFHPMQNDFTTGITSDELVTFLTHVGAAGRFLFVDFTSEEAISLDQQADGMTAKSEPKQKEVKEVKAAPAKEPKEKKVQIQFAEDHLFTRKPVQDTMFAQAFEKYTQAQVRV